MVLPMIDKLNATLNIKNYDESAKEVLSLLEDKKNEAKLVGANNASATVHCQIGNEFFEVKPNGTKGYAYILHNDKYEVKLSKFRSERDDFYPVYVSIKADQLWSNGPLQSWMDFKLWVEDNLGEINNNKINRLDLCCHTDEFECTIIDIENFKGRYFNDQIFRDRRKVTGFIFGSRSSQKVYCRIYNKTTEVSKKRKSLWFHDVWKEHDVDESKSVWNIEFELNRSYFKDVQLDNVEDVFFRLKSIWQYCSEEWLVMTLNDKSRIERSTINPIWLKLQRAFDDYKDYGLIKRTKQLQRDAQAMVPSTMGNITSYAARKGIDNIDNILDALKLEGEKYLKKNRNTKFEDQVAKKMQLLY